MRNQEMELQGEFLNRHHEHARIHALIYQIQISNTAIADVKPQYQFTYRLKFLW